jgi:hypothetical protein
VSWPVQRVGICAVLRGNCHAGRRCERSDSGCMLAGLAVSVAALADATTPRWDPQHPDKNPGARLLVPGPPTSRAVTDTSIPVASKTRSSRFELSVGRSTVSKGAKGLLLDDGYAERGSILLENVLSVGGQPAKLLTYRALSSLNHCWQPNAMLLQRRESKAVIEFDLVAVKPIDGWAAPAEVLIDYSSTPGFIEPPNTAWQCPGTFGQQPLRYSLDQHYKPWRPQTEVDAAIFSRWVTTKQERDTIVMCGNTGPDNRVGMPTSGKLPHCAGGLLHSVYRPSPKTNQDPVGTAESLFMRSQKDSKTTPATGSTALRSKMLQRWSPNVYSK